MATEFTFTPGQRQEAAEWIKENCKEIYDFLSTETSMLSPDIKMFFKDLMTDFYFKMKTITFPFRYEEFVIGIEYKDREKVIKGEEQINIRFQNPHKNGLADQFAQQVIIELLNRLK